MPLIISLDTPFMVFYNMLIEGGACKESLDFLKPFCSHTMGEAIDALPVESRQSWSFWTLEKYCDILNAGARRHLLSHIDDPMIAVSLYVHSRYLSDEDDVILKGKFAGRVPRAERELQIGKTVRRKRR